MNTRDFSALLTALGVLTPVQRDAVIKALKVRPTQYSTAKTSEAPRRTPHWSST